MAAGYEGGASASASSANKFVGQFGAGDTTISTGGQKQSQTLFIVIGAVFAVVALIVILFWGGRR